MSLTDTRPSGPDAGRGWGTRQGMRVAGRRPTAREPAPGAGAAERHWPMAEEGRGHGQRHGDPAACSPRWPRRACRGGRRLRFRAAGVSGVSGFGPLGQVGQVTLGRLGLRIKVSRTKIKFIGPKFCPSGKHTSTYSRSDTSFLLSGRHLVAVAVKGRPAVKTWEPSRLPQELGGLDLTKPPTPASRAMPSAVHPLTRGNAELTKPSPRRRERQEPPEEPSGRTGHRRRVVWRDGGRGSPRGACTDSRTELSSEAEVLGNRPRGLAPRRPVWEPGSVWVGVARSQDKSCVPWDVRILHL